MPLISHRGAAHLAKANTLEAIYSGDSYAPSFVEVDINSTSDNRLVIFHGSIPRFLTGNKMKFTYKQLKERHKDLITLDELLQIKISAPYIFDIKICDQDSLSMIITRLGGLKRDDFAFTSPHETALKILKDAYPKSLIFQNQPYYLGPLPAFEIAGRNKFEGIALNKWWLVPIVYILCKIQNKALMCYTIDSKLGIKFAQTFFPEAYIVTNRPDIYRQLYPKNN